MKKKEKLIVTSAFLLAASSCLNPIFATTLEIKSTYKGKTMPSYIRIRDANDNPVRFNSTEKGFVQSPNGTDILSPNTDNNNVFITDIKQGNYNVEGVTLDNKYIVPQSQGISIKGDRDYQSTLNLFDNAGSIKIKVVDGSNTPISGSQFEIEGLKFDKVGSGYVQSDNGNATIISDSYGNITLSNIPVGTYNIYQKSMNGYSNFVNSSIKVTYNQVSNLTAVNKKEADKTAEQNQNNQNQNQQHQNQQPQQLQQQQPDINTIRNNNINKGILKLGVRDENYLEGSKFKIMKGISALKFKKNGNNYEVSPSGAVDIIETNNSSPVSIILEPGNYKLVETESPKGYTKIKDKDFEIKKGIETKIEVKKKQEKGSLKLNVRNEAGINVKGYEFKFNQNGEMKFKKSNNVYKYDKNGDLTTLATDDNGEIKIEDIPVGKIKIKNTKVLDKYVLIKSEMTKDIEKDKEAKLDIEAEKQKNIIEVKNNGDALSNVKYKLYLEDNLLVTEETGSDGDIGPLSEDGDYYVEVLNVPEKCVIPDGKVKFTVKDGKVQGENTLNIESAMIKASLGKKEEGVSFALYKDGEKFMEEKTDEDGIANFVGLPYGNYSIKQSPRKDNKEVSDKEYNVIIDEHYKNQEPLDFSIQKAKPIKEKKKANPILIGIICIILTLLGVTGYNLYKLYKEEGIRSFEDLKRLVFNKKEIPLLPAPKDDVEYMEAETVFDPFEEDNTKNNKDDKEEKEVLDNENVTLSQEIADENIKCSDKPVEEKESEEGVNTQEKDLNSTEVKSEDENANNINK